MEKFVGERLNEVALAKGRSLEKEAEATEEEKAATRAALGALTWAAKEGRPDAAAAASLIASCLNRLRVQDIVDLNKTIKEVKKNEKLPIPVQPIGLDRLCFGVITGQLRQCSEWSIARSFWCRLLRQGAMWERLRQGEPYALEEQQDSPGCEFNVGCRGSISIQRIEWAGMVSDGFQWDGESPLRTERMATGSAQQEVACSDEAGSGWDLEEGTVCGGCKVPLRPLGQRDHWIDGWSSNGHRDAGDQAKHGWDGNRSEVGSTWSNDHRLPDQTVWQ